MAISVALRWVTRISCGKVSLRQVGEINHVRRLAGKRLMGPSAVVERNELSQARLCMGNRFVGFEIELVVLDWFARGARRRSCRASSLCRLLVKHDRQTFQQLRLPVRNLVRMNIELLRQFGQRLVTL